MRAILIVALMLGLTSPAGAAPRRHAPQPRDPNHHVVVRPREDRAVRPGWYAFPGYAPIPPEENRNLDPSNYGGG